MSVNNGRRMGDGDQIFCEDVVVIRIKDHFGHVWSPQYGRIYFTQNNIALAPDSDSNSVVSLSQVAPGVSARTWATHNQLGFQHDDSSSFPDIQWKANRIELKQQRSHFVKEGQGIVTRAHGGFGFLDSPLFDLTLFVPGFAATNNLPPGVSGYQMPQLEAKQVHFLAIPNPKKKFNNYFVIALHPLNEKNCGKCDKSEHCHWLAPVFPSKHNQQTSDFGHTSSKSSHKQEFIRRNDFFSPESVFDAPLDSPILHSIEVGPVSAGKDGYGTIECSDAAFVLIKSYCGYLWSPTVGKIYYESSVVQCSMANLTPGLAAVCSVIVNTRRGLLAVKVQPEMYRSSHVLEGTGIFRCGVACGVVFEEGIKDRAGKETPIFVPSWALSDSETATQMDGQKVHFMAIRQHLEKVTAGFKKVCIIALHVDVAECLSPATLFNKHWFTPFNRYDQSIQSSSVTDELNDSADVYGLDQCDPICAIPDMIEDIDNLDERNVCMDNAIELNDCYFTYVRPTQGYLRSAEHGMISFSERQLRGGVMRNLVPGSLARVVCVPLKRVDLLRNNVHSPSWQATCVQLVRPIQWSSEVFEGYGALVRVRRTYGMLRCFKTSNLLFVPGWAGVNNLSQNLPGWQVPQLSSCDLHFLAMPNPKRRCEPFVLSVHPVGEECSASARHTQHWLQPTQHTAIDTQPNTTTSLASLDPTSTAVAPSLNREMIRDVLVECMIKLASRQLQKVFDRCPHLLDWAYFENTNDRPDDMILSHEWHMLTKLGTL